MKMNDTDLLYKVVKEYIENHGGSTLVIGGVEVIEMPSDNKYVYHLAIKVMGKKPIKKENNETN